MNFLSAACLLCTVAFPSGGEPAPTALLDDEAALSRLEDELEDLRTRLEIPALSAGVVRDGELLWARGFGQADPKRGIAATADTPYHLASVTKTYASAVVLQLMAEGKIGLDDPIGDYGAHVERGEGVLVRHLFSHTSMQPPGTIFHYDGNRYGLLGGIVSTITGRSFEQELRSRILEPLELRSTVPGDAAARYPDVFAALARPYAFDEAHEMIESEYPTYFGAAAGLISTVPDVAKFVTALLRGELVPPELVEMAMTPARTPDGEALPYGLGWFTQEYRGLRTVWHYGHWLCNSSVVLVLPDRGLTFIALCDTDGLSRPFPLGLGEALILESPAALAFLESFVPDIAAPATRPRIDWSADRDSIVARLAAVEDPHARELLDFELRGRWNVARYVGDSAEAARLLEIHDASLVRTDAEVFGDEPMLARLDRVRPGEERAVAFTLDGPTTVRIYGIGDGGPWGGTDDRIVLEDATDGRELWRMHGDGSVSAGGHPRNRLQDVRRTLPAGRYRLRYSEGSIPHGWGAWLDFPPTHRFWGAAVLEAKDE